MPAFRRSAETVDMLTSAEDVRWDVEARLGFPPWDRIRLARMLMAGRLYGLRLNLHKIFSSELAFHHLLGLKRSKVTKEEF